MTHQIAAFGEVLWDMLPAGKQLGGAPGNFAYHCHVLGNDVMVVSRVGNDALGHEIVEKFTELSIPTDFLGIDFERPTGTVDVELDRLGHPAYQIVEDVAWDAIMPSKAMLLYATALDAICFGSLAMRSPANRVAFASLMNGVPSEALKVLDLNLRSPFYTDETIISLLSLCNLLKLNDEELIRLAGILNPEYRPNTFFTESPDGGCKLSSGAAAFIDYLIDFYSLKYVILTCGSRGSFILNRDGVCSYVKSISVPVISTVGAGDSFTAVCVDGILSGDDIDAVHSRAAQYAAFVCSQAGAMPQITPVQLREWGFPKR